MNLLDSDIEKIYFTGMLTHGQSDFYIHYIDPETSSVRSYYPDFLIKKRNGNYIIIEIKGDHQMEDPVVLAKQDFAKQMASENNMVYYMIPGTKVHLAKSILGLR